MKHLIIINILLFSSYHIFAQSENFCRTPSDIPDFLQTIPQEHVKAAKNSYILRIFVNVMRKSDGTGGLTQEEIEMALYILNKDFNPHGICFSLVGMREIKG